MSKQQTKPPRALPKKQANKIARQVAKDLGQKQRGGKNSRWNLSLDTLSAGPVSLKGLSAGSSRRDMVGLAAPASNVQVVMPRISSQRRARDGVMVDVLEGTDLVATISTSGASAGDVLVEKYINPSALAATRMAQYSPLYQRYRFRSIEFLYQPTAPATEAGQVLGFCTFDPDTPFATADPLNLQKAAAFYGNRQNQIWEPASYGQHQLDSMTDLYVDVGGADVRFSYQGIFYLIAASSIAATALGVIYCRYQLELTIPQLQYGLGGPVMAECEITGASITTGSGSIFGSSIATSASNTLTVSWVDGNTIEIGGLTTGATLLVACSGSFAGTGGALASSGFVMAYSGLTEVTNHNAAVVKTGATEACLSFYVICTVTSSSGSATLDAPVGSLSTFTSSSATANLVAIQFPESPVGLVQRRKSRAARMGALMDKLGPLVDSLDGQGVRKLTQFLESRDPPPVADRMSVLRQAEDRRDVTDRYTTVVDAGGSRYRTSHGDATRL